MTDTTTYPLERPAEHPALPTEAVQVLRRLAVLLAGITLSVHLVPVTGLVISSLLAVYAVRGARQSLEALCLLAFMLLLPDSHVSLTRWVILFAAFGRTLWDSVTLEAATPRILRPLLVFAFTTFVFSVLVSAMPLVSIFKLASFTIGVGTILTVFHRTRHLREYWLSWFLTLGLFILLASLPMYVTGQGYAKNGVGFQGILLHPQTYGPVVAPITALLTGWVLFLRNRSPWIVGAAAVGWMSIYTSQSRTAFLAAAGGFALVFVIAMLKGRWRPLLFRAFSLLNLLILCCLAILLTLLFYSTIQQRLTRFLLKDEGSESVVESLSSSREALVDRSIQNFWSEPVTGIGFGVPSELERARVETGPFGLPVSASVEKGFMPSAVLEETGLIGALLVLYLLFHLFAPVLRQGSIWLFWMLVTALLINGGEMVFFSIGGMGFYFWVVMAFCYTYAQTTPRPEAPVPKPTQPLQYARPD